MKKLATIIAMLVLALTFCIPQSLRENMMQ